MFLAIFILDKMILDKLVLDKMILDEMLFSRVGDLDQASKTETETLDIRDQDLHVNRVLQV